MIHINIISRQDQLFFAHWDKERYNPSEFDIRENSWDDIDWDCVVVYQDIPEKRSFRCRQGGVMYFSGEHPLSCPCPHSFTEQFDCVVLPHYNVIHTNKVISHGYLNWSLGYGHFSKTHRYNFHDLKTLDPPKQKLFSICSSNQTMMPGHIKRMRIIKRLQHDYPEYIDIFGRGFNAVDYKADALLPYRFHICMENCCIPDYWTEKFADPVLSLTVPIYSGATNIAKYFGKDGYITFNVDDYTDLRIIIDRLISNSNYEYNQRRKALERIRATLMDEQNIIPYISKRALSVHDSTLIRQCNILPLKECQGYKSQMIKIRAERFLYKASHPLSYIG